MSCTREVICAVPMDESLMKAAVWPLGNATADKVISAMVPKTVVGAATPILAWVILVLYATFTTNHSFETLSIKKSLNELCGSRNSPLVVLDVFRLVAIFWVIMNHTGSEGRIDVLERLPSAQQFKLSVHEHPLFGALLGNSALGVEIFLVLSGLLAAISWLRAAGQPFWKHYFRFLTRRWLRLFPSVAVFIFLATGPIMKTLIPRYHTTMIAACGISGIASHLSFTGNWQSAPTCLGYLWYLGLDMQLYIAAPFVLHVLYNRPKKGIASILLITGMSAILRALYCIVYSVCNNSDVDIPFIWYPDQDAITTSKIYAGIWEMYARPYTKCGPFLLGILVGFCVMKKNVQISMKKSLVMFSASAVVAVATIYAILPEYWYPDQGNTIYNITYTALFRTIFAAAISLMIMSLIFREKRPSVSTGFSIFARLTFSAYLLHMPIVYLFNHVSFLQAASGPYELLAISPFIAAMSFLAAFIFYIFIESPLGRLSYTLQKSILS